MRIDKHIVEPEEVIEVHAQRQLEKQHKLIASIRPHGGHFLWEINLQTGSVELAEFEKIDADFVSALKGVSMIKKKVIARPACMYISALNKRNAIKQLKKEFAAGERMINGMKN